MVGRIGDASRRLAGHADQRVELLQSSHDSTLHQQLETDQVPTAITEMSVQIASAVAEQSVVSEDIKRNIAGNRSGCEVTVDAGQQSQRNSGDVADLAAALRCLAQDFWQSRR